MDDQLVFWASPFWRPMLEASSYGYYWMVIEFMNALRVRGVTRLV